MGNAAEGQVQVTQDMQRQEPIDEDEQWSMVVVAPTQADCIQMAGCLAASDTNNDVPVVQTSFTAVDVNVDQETTSLQDVDMVSEVKPPTEKTLQISTFCGYYDTAELQAAIQQDPATLDTFTDYLIDRGCAVDTPEIEQLPVPSALSLPSDVVLAQEDSPPPHQEGSRSLSSLSLRSSHSSRQRELSLVRYPVFKINKGNWQDAKYKGGWTYTQQLGLIKHWAKQHWIGSKDKQTFEQLQPYLLQQYGQVILEPQFYTPLEIMINGLVKSVSRKRHFKYEQKKVKNKDLRKDSVRRDSAKAAYQQNERPAQIVEGCATSGQSDKLKTLISASQCENKDQVQYRTRLWESKQNQLWHAARTGTKKLSRKI